MVINHKTGDMQFQRADEFGSQPFLSAERTSLVFFNPPNRGPNLSLRVCMRELGRECEHESIFRTISKTKTCESGDSEWNAVRELRVGAQGILKYYVIKVRTNKTCHRCSYIFTAKTSA